MKDVPFDVIYPYKPVKLLLNPDKNHIINWKNPKQPSNYFDWLIHQHKKDEKLSPNHYFKTNNNEELIDYKKYSTSDMFTSKKHLISVMPKLTLIDIV